MLVLGILIGLGIAVLFIALFVRYSLWLTGKFSNLDKATVRENVSKLLIHGYNYETLNFSDAGDDVFAQFKKYIHSEDDFGVDFVFPMAGRYDGKKPRVLEICNQHNLHFELIETKDGWFFAFIQMNDGAAISNTAIDAALELAEFDFSKDIGVSENSTFKWLRKREVLGRQKLYDDDPSRYEIFPSEP